MSARGWPGPDDRGDDLRALARRAGALLPPLRPGSIGLGLAVVLLLILLLSSWYTVQPEQTAVVQRFGRVVRTAGPGLHFKLPYGIERVRLVPTARVLKEEFGFRTTAAGQRTRYAPAKLEQESLMLTGDLNVIDVEWIVQYRIEDPVAYLFRMREPRETIRDLAEAW